MIETRIHIMRFILVLLLFQFMAPVLPSASAQDDMPDHQTCVYPQHHALIMPVLLKEKEETESRSADSFAPSVPLIDFSDHSCVLAEFHTAKSTPSLYDYRYDRCPPLFTLHSSFLI